jgi:ribosomal-protein-serine acetyltransferase
MDVQLLPARPELAPELFAVVDGSRDSIAAWLPWAQATKNVGDERSFLSGMVEAALAKRTFMFVIQADGVVVGAIDLHNVDHESQHAEVGYFLAESARGQGITAAALRQLEHFGFGDLALNKITILAATDNLASRKVAEHAGYVLEGVEREEIKLLDGRYHDAARYSKLKREAQI